MSCHLVDIHVGKRIKAKRIKFGMSQQALASAAGTTPHQIKQYEIGKGRLPSSHLHDISKALGVSIGYFFEELGKR